MTRIALPVDTGAYRGMPAAAITSTGSMPDSKGGCS
jgi:hypothetical protein